MTVHIIGAGIAGLATALALADAGTPAIVYEMTDHAGGRCRSYHDRHLDRIIDNGTHLLVGANAAAFRYLDRIGGRDGVAAVGEAGVPFVDLARGDRWTARLGGGAVPWWLLLPSRRIPGTRIGEYLRLRALLAAPPGATVAEVLGHGTLMDRLWRPMTEAALNTQPEEASAELLKPVVQGLLLGGKAAARIYMARDGLGATFIAPALARLAESGIAFRTHARLRHLRVVSGAVVGLEFDGDAVGLAPGDRVVLAVPHAAAAELVPGVLAPTTHRAIVNVHFAVPSAAPPLLGLIGGTAHWLCRRGDVLSTTTSAADDLAARPAEEIAAAVWRDVALALGLAASPPPPHRVVKEHHATFAQTPAEAARRGGPGSPLGNLVLAGDWTATGLPATIDSAAASGEAAARLVLAARSEKP